MPRSAKFASDKARDLPNAGRAASHHDGAVPQAVQGHHAPAAQRAKIDAIHASPHQAIQRKKMAGAFGATAQLAAVKETKLGEAALIPEVGADFRNNHMSPDLNAAKELSKSADRLARTFTNTVVLGTEEDVKAALGNAPYSATPVNVAGLNTVNIRTNTKNKSFKPEDVESQDVVPGPGVTKVKVRLAADDDKKTSTAPTASPTGPVLVATGVMGGPMPQAPKVQAPKPQAKAPPQVNPKPVAKAKNKAPNKPQAVANPPGNAAPKPKGRRRGPPRY